MNQDFVLFPKASVDQLVVFLTTKCYAVHSDTEEMLNIIRNTGQILTVEPTPAPEVVDQEPKDLKDVQASTQS